MAKYDILYACGHEGVVLVERRERDVERRLTALEQGRCPTCASARFAEATCEEPPLSGTPKQCAWATDLRGRLLQHLAQLPVNDAHGVALLYAAIRRQTSAAWWIEHRDHFVTPEAAVAHLTCEDAALRAYALTKQAARQARR